MSAFTDYQEDEIVNNILTKLKSKEVVTIAYVSKLAMLYYYSLIAIATKYLIVKELNQKRWPFDEQSNIIIDNFNQKVQELLDEANDEPQKLLNSIGVKEFTASFSWV